MDSGSGLYLEFDNNRFLALLFGEHDQFLHRIENLLDVEISARGNSVVIKGDVLSSKIAEAVMQKLYSRIKKGNIVSIGEVDAAVRMAIAAKNTENSHNPEFQEDKIKIQTKRKVIMPRSPGQEVYMDVLQHNRLVFAIGPAGTGKTYLAVATGISLLLDGKVDRLILSRPAVEAGEKLGFLPGDLREKIDPYLRPLYDALYDMLPNVQVTKMIESDQIEVAPLAFMRGRTLANSYIILDEAQNTTAAQMKMFLTRMGEGAYMVVTGDKTQIDLPTGQLSGLKDAEEVLRDVKDIAFMYLDVKDVVRHPLVSKIVTAYEKRDNRPD